MRHVFSSFSFSFSLFAFRFSLFLFWRSRGDVENIRTLCSSMEASQKPSMTRMRPHVCSYMHACRQHEARVLREKREEQKKMKMATSRLQQYEPAVCLLLSIHLFRFPVFLFSDFSPLLPFLFFCLSLFYFFSYACSEEAVTQLRLLLADYARNPYVA